MPWGAEFDHYISFWDAQARGWVKVRVFANGDGTHTLAFKNHAFPARRLSVPKGATVEVGKVGAVMMVHSSQPVMLLRADSELWPCSGGLSAFTRPLLVDGVLRVRNPVANGSDAVVFLQVE